MLELANTDLNLLKKKKTEPGVNIFLRQKRNTMKIIAELSTLLTFLLNLSLISVDSVT